MKLSFKERAQLIRRALAGSWTFEPNSVGGNLLTRINPGTLGPAPKRGTKAFEEAYSNSPWLRAVESRIGAATSAVCWQLYSTKRAGAPKAHRDYLLQRAGFATRKSLIQEREAAGDLVEIPDHPFLTALDKGNAVMTGVGLRKITQIAMDLVGESFWLKDRNLAGAPSAFWPIPASWILSTPTPTHPFFRISQAGFQADVPATEILWMRDPDVANPYGRGSGQAQAIGDELDTDEYAANTVKQFFYNGARPDFMVSPSGIETWSDADRRRLSTEWRNEHQGFMRAFKPLFASRALEVHEFEKDFSKLQLVELREFERNMILQVLGGIPPEMLGILENSNRATIDAAAYLMATQVLVPRLELMRSYFQEWLIPDYDARLIVDYESPVPEDKARELEAMKAAEFGPTVNEWRKAQGLPPLPGTAGDQHILSTLQVPTTFAEPTPQDVAPARTPPDPDAGDEGAAA